MIIIIINNHQEHPALCSWVAEEEGQATFSNVIHQHTCCFFSKIGLFCFSIRDQSHVIIIFLLLVNQGLNARACVCSTNLLNCCFQQNYSSPSVEIGANLFVDINGIFIMTMITIVKATLISILVTSFILQCEGSSDLLSFT